MREEKWDVIENFFLFITSIRFAFMYVKKANNFICNLTHFANLINLENAQ